MHDSRKIFLLEPEPRYVTVIYEPGKTNTAYGFKTYDLDIQPEDYVIIPTDSRHMMTVGQVVEVDLEPNITSDSELKWLIGRVDTTIYEKSVERENSFLTMAKSAERKRLKRELQADVLAEIDEEQLKLISPVEEKE